MPPWARHAAAGTRLRLQTWLRQGEPRAPTWAPGKQGPGGSNSPATLLPLRERANAQSLAGKQQPSAFRTKRENLCESSAFAGKEESGLWAAAACLSRGAPQCGVRNQPRTEPSLPGHPVCPREKRVGACVSRFKERDKPFTTVPGACLERAQHAAPGAQRSPWHCTQEREAKQESQPSEEERPVARQGSPTPCAERQTPGCSGNTRGRLGHGRELHSEKGVWAEGRPVLCL